MRDLSITAKSQGRAVPKIAAKPPAILPALGKILALDTVTSSENNFLDPGSRWSAAGLRGLLIWLFGHRCQEG